MVFSQVNLSGAGKIDYYGEVREQSVNISGFGRVKRAD